MNRPVRRPCSRSSALDHPGGRVLPLVPVMWIDRVRPLRVAEQRRTARRSGPGVGSTGCSGAALPSDRRLDLARAGAGAEPAAGRRRSSRGQAAVPVERGAAAGRDPGDVGLVPPRAAADLVHHRGRRLGEEVGVGELALAPAPAPSRRRRGPSPSRRRSAATSIVAGQVELDRDRRPAPSRDARRREAVRRRGSSVSQRPDLRLVRGQRRAVEAGQPRRAPAGPGRRPWSERNRRISVTSFCSAATSASAAASSRASASAAGQAARPRPTRRRSARSTAPR